MQAITAIDRMTVENGPLKIIMGVPEEGDLFLDKLKDQKEVEEKIGVKTAFTVDLNQGDTIFMHPYLIHGSDPNISNDPQNTRRVLVNGFSFPGANKKPYPGEGSTQTISLK